MLLLLLLLFSSTTDDRGITKERFSDAVVDAWKTCSKTTVLQYVVSEEFHADGGTHLHMAVKLAKKARWLTVRKFLDEQYQMKVNFSDNHATYYSAYKYVTKEDPSFIVSDGHPDLSDPTHSGEPKTARGTKKRKQKASSSKESKKKRLAVYDVVELIQAGKIKTRLELMALVSTWKREGKPT